MVVLPTPGGPESRAHLAQAPLSLLTPQGAGLGAAFFPPVLRWFLFQPASQLFSLFMLDFSPCWPMMALQLLGLYLSTNSSVSPAPTSDRMVGIDFATSGSILGILGIFRSILGLSLVFTTEVDGSSLIVFFSSLGLFFSDLNCLSEDSFLSFFFSSNFSGDVLGVLFSLDDFSLIRSRN